MIGYVIETYEDGCYEVEFSDSTTGVTLALLSVTEEDIRLSADPGSSSGQADGALLQGLIRAELGRLRLDHWGYFFPAHIAVWRFIREKRPSALDDVKAGYDKEPWFAGRGAHWFMETLVNREDFVDLVEKIMYAAADHALATPAKERGFLLAKETPEVDLAAASRLARIVLDAVDEGQRTNAIT